MHPADSIGKQMGHSKDRSLLALLGEGDRVGEHHFRKAARVNTFGCRIAHDGMRAEGAHALGSVFHHQVGGFW